MKKSVFRYTKIIAIFMPNHSKIAINFFIALKLVLLDENMIKKYSLCNKYIQSWKIKKPRKSGAFLLVLRLISLNRILFAV